MYSYHILAFQCLSFLRWVIKCYKLLLQRMFKLDPHILSLVEPLMEALPFGT